MAAIRQGAEVFWTEHHYTVMAALCNYRSSAWPAPGKDDIHLEPSRPVPNFRLLPFFSIRKATLHRPFNIEFLDIILIFCATE